VERLEDRVVLSTLYLGDQVDGLRIVDQSTGVSSVVGGSGGSGTVAGLSSRGTETAFVYAVENIQDNSRLVKFNTATGIETEYPVFSESTLGVPEPFATAIAISPTNPNIAVVAGFNGDFSDTHFGDDFLWQVNVSTGAVLGSAVSTSSSIRALTYSLDGSTLYGTIGSQLVTVNPATGSAWTVGSTGLSSFLEGLAFRPEDGALFAIDAYYSDNLVRLNPNTGSLIQTIGNVGIAGPEGLAFTSSSGGGGDTTPPTVTNRIPTPGSTIMTSTINVDVTFSEQVQGVDSTDLVLGGTAAGAANVGSPTSTGGNTWRFPVAGLTSGTLNVNLAPDANDIEDAAGNDLQPISWSYAADISSAQPILHFDFEYNNDNSGTLGSSHDGTTYGNASYSTDAIQGQYSVNMGTDGYVKVPAFAFGNTATVTTWVKGDFTGPVEILARDGMNTVFSTRSLTNSPSGALMFVNHWNTQNRAVVFESGNTSTYQGTETPSGVVQSNVWHHLALTINRPTDTVEIYVDGTLVKTGTGSAFLENFTDNQAMYIGAPGTLMWWHFTGNIDDFRVYNSVLTQTEIAGLVGPPDTTPPSVTGRTPAPGSTVGTSTDIDVTFSEPVKGVDYGDLILTGTGAGSAIVGTPTNTSGNTWRFPVSGLSNGTLNVSLAPDANDIEDLAGNDLGNVTWSYTVSLAAPALEDFETGDFSRFSWQQSGNANWYITTSDRHNGTYSARSGSIGNSQSTTLQVTMNTNAGDVSFWRRVSSESRYDYLRFYVDGAQKGAWSGYQSWAQQTYSVSAGTHTFKWAYTKDGSISRGSDAAWIDDIVFPVATDTTPPTVTGRSPSPGSTITAPSVDVDVTFSEAVKASGSGAPDASDMVLSGTAAGSALVGSPANVSGNTWRFPVSGLSSGTLNVSLAPDANDVEDLAGNDLGNVTWDYTVTVSGPQQLFYDPFPTSSLNTSNWTYTYGSPYVSSSAYNEPSSPYSLNLDYYDQARSRPIDLSGASSAELNYYWQRYSTESGDDLYVDYWNGTSWQRLRTHYSYSGSQRVFYEESVSLPTAALHSGFRFRFVSSCSSSADDWYIDNVEVTATVGDTTPPTVTGRSPSPGSTITAPSVDIDVTFSEAVKMSGSGMPDASDMVLSGTAAGSASVGSPANLGGNTWRFPVTGLAVGTLDVSLAPDANDIEDLAGNDLANVTWNYTVAIPPVLDPEPAITQGITNTISWSTVPGADEYYAEYDDDSDFSSPVGNSGWIAGTTHTFDGLSDGQTYHYRVHARKQTSVSTSGSWTQTTQTEFQANTFVETVAATTGDVVLASGTGAVFEENFEDGDYDGWIAGTGSCTRQVTSQTASGGTHSFTIIGGSDHYQGVSRSVPNVAPDRIDFYVRGNSNSRYQGYAVFGQGSSLSQQAVFFYMRADGTMGISGYNFYYGVPYQGNRWYKISLLFDWAAKNVDYYVDDSLRHSNIPFRANHYGTTLTHIRKAYLYNRTSGSQAWWDEIEFSGAGGTGYASSGSLASTVINPSAFEGWDTLNFNDTTPTGTTLAVDVLPETGSTPIPGYSNVSSGVDVSGISHPSIRLRANLATTDATVTPSLHDWTVTWQESTATYVESGWSNVESSLQDDAPPRVMLTAPSLTDVPTPTITVGATDANGLPDGTAVALDVDLNDDGDFDDSGERDYTGASLIAGTTTFQVTPGLVDGHYLLRARVLDVVGNEGEATAPMTVQTNQPPVADAGDSYNGFEGSPLTFSAAASTDPDGDALQYRWDFDGDNVYDTPWSFTPTASNTWQDDYSGAVKVQVFDGEYYDEDTATVAVRNVAPTIEEVLNSGPVHEGSPVTVTITASDPGEDELTYWFDFDDDGAFEVFNTTGEAQYVFGDNGVFDVNVRVTDDDGGVGGLAASKLYWVDPGNDTVKRANLDGSNIEILVDVGLVAPFGLAIDSVEGKIYWSDVAANTISRAGLDGSNVETLVDAGLADPAGVDLDLMAGKVYWTDWGDKTIKRANLDGSNVETLVANTFAAELNTPLDIALDVAAGKMYWVDWGNDTIKRANLDGSSIEILVHGGISAPNGILDGTTAINLDVAAGKMYWVDSGNDTIKRADLDGSNVETLIDAGLEAPGVDCLALDLTAGQMYWTDIVTKTISRADLDGSNMQTVVDSGLSLARGLEILANGGGGPAATTVTVENVAPTIDAVRLSAASIAEGQLVTVSGEFSDPALGVATETFTATAVWSDGITTPVTLGAGTFSTTRGFPDDHPDTGTPSDTFTVDITVTDDDGGSDTATSPSLTVNNVRPVITSFSSKATFDDKHEEGELVQFSASFADVGVLDTHTATINWDDENEFETVTVTQDPNGGGTVTASHDYDEGGVFTVTLTLTDDDTGTAVETTTAVIIGAGVNDGVLQIVGGDDANHVTVNEQGNGLFKVHADFFPEGNHRTFDAALIDYIQIWMCDGDDHATIAGSIDTPATMYGGDGDDHLNGGGGRTIMIGGLGADRLVGGPGDDILIGGTTDYDFNDVALLALLDEWNSDRNYDQRVANITNGSGPVLEDLGFQLNDDTVSGNLDIDKLTGSSGENWLFADDIDEVTGSQEGDASQEDAGDSSGEADNNGKKKGKKK